MADALIDLANTGTLELTTRDRVGADVVSLVQDRTHRLLNTLPSPSAATDADGDRTSWAINAAQAGTIEYAAHGWDISAALRKDHPLPDDVASRILSLASTLIGDESRGAQFGPVVQLPAGASPNGQLMGFLGRRQEGSLTTGARRRPAPVEGLSSLRAFIEDARRRVASADPAELDGLMQAAADRRVLPWIVVRSGSETMLHRSDELTVFALSGKPRMAFPPHEHTVPATIAVLEGVETNVFYRLTEPTDAIREVSRRTVHAGEVLALDSSVIHSVQYPTEGPTLGLHVYRGDLVGAHRRLWSDRGRSARPYDQSVYDGLGATI